MSERWYRKNLVTGDFDSVTEEDILETISARKIIKWLAGALVTDRLLAYAEILEDEYMLRHGFVPVEDVGRGETPGQSVVT